MSAVLPNTAWMPFLASKDIKPAAGKAAQVRGFGRSVVLGLYRLQQDHIIVGAAHHSLPQSRQHSVHLAVWHCHVVKLRAGAAARNSSQNGVYCALPAVPNSTVICDPLLHNMVGAVFTTEAAVPPCYCPRQRLFQAIRHFPANPAPFIHAQPFLGMEFLVLSGGFAAQYCASERPAAAADFKTLLLRCPSTLGCVTHLRLTLWHHSKGSKHSWLPMQR